MAPEQPLLCPILSSSREIACAHMSLRSFPKHLEQFTNLCSIDLTHNYIEEIPEAIGLLKNLENLWLSGNKIKSVPESLSFCTKLCHLDLRYNELTTIPASFCNMLSLRKLFLICNRIEELPFELGLLVNRLECFLIQGNDAFLNSLPTCIKRCPFHEMGILEYLLKLFKERTNNGISSSLVEASAQSIISSILVSHNEVLNLDILKRLNCDLHNTIFQAIFKLPLKPDEDWKVLSMLIEACSICRHRFSTLI